MDRDEMREAAERIARDPTSYPSVRMSALRLLRDLDDKGERSRNPADPPKWLVRRVDLHRP